MDSMDPDPDLTAADDPADAVRELFARYARERREKWAARLTELAAAAEPAGAVDAAALLAALGNNRAVTALAELAARLVAGGSLPIEDAAAALARLDHIESERLSGARRMGAHSVRRR